MTIWNTIATERRRVADELETFTDEMWAASTCCPGWNVQEVAAHLLVPFEVSLPRFALTMMKNRGDFDKAMIELTARVASGKSRAEIIAALRANAENQWTPPSGGAEIPLAEIVVHAQDIRRAVGLDHEVPQATIELALNGVKDLDLRNEYTRRLGLEADGNSAAS